MSNLDSGAGVSQARILGGNVAVGIPSSGSIGNNGALTGVTAFPTTFTEGLYLYFPANAIAAGSAAGFYWTVMSSTTAGTIYNNTYASGTPTVPASPTAFATTGPGAYTQTINTDIATYAFAIPGGSLGINGTLRCNYEWLYNTAAGNKLIKRKLNTNSYATSTRTTSGGHDSQTDRIKNCGSASFQRYFQSAESSTAGTTGIISSAIDTTVDTTFSLALNIDTATNYALVLGLTVEIIKLN